MTWFQSQCRLHNASDTNTTADGASFYRLERPTRDRCHPGMLLRENSVDVEKRFFTFSIPVTYVFNFFLIFPTFFETKNPT